MKKYMIAKEYAKLHHKQAGMTLIELTVVLLILIGLAGLLIPYVGGFLSKTHDSVNSTSEKELAGAVQRFDVQYSRFPDSMDSLTDSSGTLINYFIADRMAGAASASTKYGMTAINLSVATAPVMTATTADSTAATAKAASICSSLRKGGINKTRVMDSATNTTASPPVGTTLAANFNPTFNYYNGTTTFDWAAMGACSGYVVELTDTTKIAQATGMAKTEVDAKIAAGHTFVAFGTGTASELMGRTVQDAPVHFASNGEYGATNAYNRLLTIFEVDASETKAPSAADRVKFTGTAMAMHDLLGVSSSLASYHKGMTE